MNRFALVVCLFFSVALSQPEIVAVDATGYPEMAKCATQVKNDSPISHFARFHLFPFRCLELIRVSDLGFDRLPIQSHHKR